MRFVPSRIAWLLLLGLLPTSLLTGCAEPPQLLQKAPVTATATIEPLGYLLDRVGGERVDVQVLIPTGRSPHEYEPRPGDLKALLESDLLLRVGHPSFAFEERLLESTTERSPDLQQISLMEVAGTAVEGLEEPHPWLAPPVLELIARELGERLAEIDPEGADGYRQRAEAFAAEARALEAELAQFLAASPCRAFLVDHPAWGAFARRYGLVELAIEHGGKEPGPASLQHTVEAARVARIQLMLVRPGRPEATSLSVARALGAETEVLDPLSRDIPATLRKAAELISRSCDHD
ncbi:MAG: zinc ABC transporter substrate-binding protein [Acidobacteriota bacterium]|nr:zinc ABC transporter substrate-binding protein [Acidobacteriota bacterium]